MALLQTVIPDALMVRLKEAQATLAMDAAKVQRAALQRCEAQRAALARAPDLHPTCPEGWTRKGSTYHPPPLPAASISLAALVATVLEAGLAHLPKDAASRALALAPKRGRPRKSPTP